jgi:hypothetical protein
MLKIAISERFVLKIFKETEQEDQYGPKIAHLNIETLHDKEHVIL